MNIKFISLLFLINFLVNFFLVGSEIPELKYKLIEKKFLNSTTERSLYVEFDCEPLPKNKLLNLKTKGLNNLVNDCCKIFINSNNQIASPAQELTLIFGVSGKGEKVTYIITDEKNNPLTETTIIPYPLECSDDKGHKLTLEIIEQTGSHFYLKGTGFSPGESLTLITKSESEMAKGKLYADFKGQIHSMLSPAVIGVYNGKASVEIKGKTADLKIDYKWEKAAFDLVRKYLVLEIKMEQLPCTN